jgi:hypothetical protein
MSVLFEAGLGVLLNIQPDEQPLFTPVQLSWEFGPLFNRSDWAWGITIMAVVDDIGGRWGTRPRYTRRLGSGASLDLGAGTLLGGESDHTGPGFAGLIGASYNDVVSVNLELHVIPRSVGIWECCSSNGNELVWTETELTTWVWMLGVRSKGVAAVVFSALELFLGVAAAP